MHIVPASTDIYSLGVVLQEVRSCCETSGADPAHRLHHIGAQQPSSKVIGDADWVASESCMYLSHRHDLPCTLCGAGPLTEQGFWPAAQVVTRTPQLQRGLPCEAVAPRDAPADVLQLIDDCLQRRSEDRPTAKASQAAVFRRSSATLNLQLADWQELGKNNS